MLDLLHRIRAFLAPSDLRRELAEERRQRDVAEAECERLTLELAAALAALERTHDAPRTLRAGEMAPDGYFPGAQVPDSDDVSGFVPR